MDATHQPYVGQPSPGATIPLPATTRPQITICSPHVLTPRLVDLGQLREPFTTDEAIRHADFHGCPIAFARKLHELGYAAVKDRRGVRRWSFGR